MVDYFVGIDVAVSKDCSFYIIDRRGKYQASGWFPAAEPEQLLAVLRMFSAEPEACIAIGIDAPRMPLQTKRNRQWDGKTSRWVNAAKPMNGRECEVLINHFKLANCQWTRLLEESPDWMLAGFQLFTFFKNFTHVFEVFPSASYTLFQEFPVTVEVNFAQFKPGIKDMIDAVAGAVTVAEFVKGNGCELGGEDGLGSIILPARVKNYPF